MPGGACGARWAPSMTHALCVFVCVCVRACAVNVWISVLHVVLDALGCDEWKISCVVCRTLPVHVCYMPRGLCMLDITPEDTLQKCGDICL